MIVIIILGLLFSVWLLVRNKRVYKFCQLLLDMSGSYARRHDYSIDVFDWFYAKYSYEWLLFSFKPLKLEAWFTKEELERINS